MTRLKIKSLRLGFPKRKPSLKDSILGQRGVHVKIESLRLDFHVYFQVAFSHLRTHKPSLKGSIYRPKIEPLRLEMSSSYILSKPAY